MMSDHYREAREVFMGALALGTVEERARYLDEACQARPELRREVEERLDAHGQAGTFLEGNPPGEGGLVEGPGITVGHYKLLEEIGEGAFGRVFMAEQIEPVRRKVALKLVKPGMDSREVVARFEAERQALALMDHPHIAHVLDAGTTETGRPYFVMELVRGLPITRYCDEHDLPMGERLRLFTEVCHAIQHAHQKGVIHRDLKPSNILVTELDGQSMPKVIDFGVAKALGQQLTEKTLFTAFQQLVGTPAYMSPEQTALSAADVDTRSDVYSLGVLLYELLTGATPLDMGTLHQAGLDEMRRMIRETEPPKPSTKLRSLGRELSIVAHHRHAEPSTLTRLVTGDLDWIVMKALEKDRARRYQTITALAEDIDRHLASEPVKAGPPGMLYRARKFVRRHRMGAVLGATFTSAMLVSLAAAIVGYTQVRLQRNRAVAAEQQAVAERDRAVTAEQATEQERDRAELHAAQSALAGGQMVLESGDRRGLLDLAEAYRLAERSPALKQVIGRRWALWHALWDQVTLVEQPHAGRDRGGDPQISSPDHLQYASLRWRADDNVDRNVYLYDTLTGGRVAGPLVHESAAKGCAFSPDGRLFATVTEKGVIHLWDRNNGESAHPPRVTKVEELRALSFSPCGRYLCASPAPMMGGHPEPRSTKVVLFHMTEPGQPAHVLEHRCPADQTRFSPDGELLAVFCSHELQLWRTADLQRHGAPLPGGGFAEFNADGTRLVFKLRNPQAIALLDTRSMRIERTLPNTTSAEAAGISHDGRLLVSYHKGDHVSLWNLDSPGKPYATQRLDGRMQHRILFNRDDSLLALAVRTGTIHVINTRDGSVFHKLRTAPNPTPAFLPDGLLAVVAGDGTHFWDLGAPPLPGSVLPHDALVHSMAFDASGEILAVGGRNELRLWRMNPSPRLEHVVPVPGRVVALEFPRGERQFAAFSDNGILTMVEPITGHAASRVNIDRGWAAPASLSPDAGKLALFGWQVTMPALLVDMQTRVASRLTATGNGGISVDFRPDSQHLAVGLASWCVLDYDLGAGSPMLSAPPTGLGGWGTQVAYHPGGRFLAVCVERHLIRLYDSQVRRAVTDAHGKPVVRAAMRQQQRTFLKVSDSYETSLAKVDHLEFSPDGFLLAAAGRKLDGGWGIELWHVDLDRGLHRAGEPLPCDHPLWCLSFSPDGRMLAAGGLGATRFWLLPPFPDDPAEVLSMTRRTLGIPLKGDREQAPEKKQENAIAEIRARIAGDLRSSPLALETAIGSLSDESLESLRQLADQYRETTVYRQLLAHVHSVLVDTKAGAGRHAEALGHAREAIRLGHEDPETRYKLALLYLGTGDTEGYRAACREMAQHYESRSDPDVIRWVSLATALAPGAAADDEGLVEDLQVAVLRVGGRRLNYRFFLGATLVRAGRPAEAVILLEHLARRLDGQSSPQHYSPIHCKLLLAISHATLGHTTAARGWQEAAAYDLRALTNPEKTDLPTSTIPWDRQLASRILQDELRTLLDGGGTDREAVSALQKVIVLHYRKLDRKGAVAGLRFPGTDSGDSVQPAETRAGAGLLAREWLALREILDELGGQGLEGWRTSETRILLRTVLLALGRDAPTELQLLSAGDDLLIHRQHEIPVSIWRRLRFNLPELTKYYYNTTDEGLSSRIAADLLDAGMPAEAEPLAREWLAVRKRLDALEPKRPDSWRTIEARGLLGAILLAREKFTDAEPLLDAVCKDVLAGRGGKFPDGMTPRPQASLRRLLRHYEDTGQAEKASPLKELIARLEQAE